MEKKKTTAIYTNISILRIIATLAVVFLHTCSTLISPLFTHYQLSEEMYGFFFNGRECMRWSVPVFIMITGALLLKKGKVTTIQDCLKKYVLKMATVLLIFGVPMAWFTRIYYEGAVSWEIFWAGFTDVLTMHSWDHLWYIYSLMAVYLILPLLQIYVNHVNEQEERYILIVLFIVLFLIPDIYLTLKNYVNPVFPIGYWVFYLLAGHYLYDKNENKALNKPLILLLGLIGVLMLMPKLASEHIYNEKIILYDNPYLACVAMFLFVACLQIHIQDPKKILWKLDRLCFGVYLVHPIFIHLAYSYFKWTPVTGTGDYQGLTFLFFVAFTVLSFVVTWILKKIPYLNKII